MSDSSDSEDDISLDQLAARKKVPAKKKSSSSAATKKKSSTKKKKAATPTIESSDDSSDDDMSLADLAKKIKKPAAKKKKKSAAASKSKKKSAATKKKKKPAATKKRARAATSSSKSDASKAKKRKTSSLQGAGDTEKEFKTSIDDFKSGTNHSRKVVTSGDVKLQLSLAVLCRWWYVMEWPENTGPHPGSDYVEMAGMPGVYVGTNNNVVGQMIDTRDHASPNKPSIANMMSKDCSELIRLWVGALEKQLIGMKERDDAYRCGNSNRNEFIALLQGELKHAKALNAAKLQKHADRQLKKKSKK